MLPTLASYAQTKKVVLEDFTGINCCWCPEGTEIAENLESANPANFIPIAIHTGSYTPSSSPLKTPEGDAVKDMAMPSGYPNGAVDRKIYGTNTKISMSRGSWTAAFNARKSLPGKVSVSFSKPVHLSGNNYEVDVNVKFTSAPTAGVPLKLQVYVLEDSIAATGALSQVNCSSVQPGVSPLANFFHNNVLRKALGGTWGYSGVIPATPVINTTYTKKVTFSVVAGASPTGWVKKHLSLVAFVAYDGTAANDQKEIINAESISLKSFFPLSVDDLSNNVSVLNAYPNPANASDVVKVEFNMNESAEVKMTVLNALGQVVAQPWTSYEIKGAHTIRWRASDYGLAPGVYMIHLSTPNGATTQRITIK